MDDYLLKFNKNSPESEKVTDEIFNLLNPENQKELLRSVDLLNPGTSENVTIEKEIQEIDKIDIKKFLNDIIKKEREKEYFQRPEVKQRRKAYEQRPEVKQRAKELRERRKLNKL